MTDSLVSYRTFTPGEFEAAKSISKDSGSTKVCFEKTTAF